MLQTGANAGIGQCRPYGKLRHAAGLFRKDREIVGIQGKLLL
jgi:hypothetical protein